MPGSVQLTVSDPQKCQEGLREKLIPGRMKAFGKSHSLGRYPWSRCAESVTYGRHHILMSAQGMWELCVWLAFSGKGQEACGKNLLLPGR